MRTVSTKLEKNDHERFLELCNKEGCTVSETIRDMVLQWCDANEEDIETDDPKPIVTIIEDEPKPGTFNCANGFLYKNGILVGNCTDYNLRNGQVYDKKGEFLGNIQH